MPQDNDWFLYLVIAAMAGFMLVLMWATVTDRDPEAP
ncbi:hypothetical protein ABIC16_001908 [Sphingomonas sp. PvP055]